MSETIDYLYVKKELDKMNISIDIQTIQCVYNFIQTYVGTLCDIRPRVHIPAAAAIICESRKIPTVDGKGFTTNGIKVEDIMRHLIEGVSKEQYLETIQTQIKKWNNEDPQLGEKINKLKLSFRIFKKFKSIFQELCKTASVPYSLVSNYLSLFWLVFLLIKFKQGITEDINESTKALSIVIQEVFTKYIGNLETWRIQQCITKGANFPGIPRISEAQKIYTKSIITQIVNNIVQYRCNLENFSLENIKQDQKLLTRLVDDISYEYQIQYRQQCDLHLIDQMTYLELSKDLTPLVHKTAIQHSHQISKVLNFTDDMDDDDMSLEFNQQAEANSLDNTISKPYTFSEIPVEQTPQKKTQRKISFNPSQSKNYEQQKKSIQMTPVTNSMAKQEWAKKYLNGYDEQKRIMIENVLKNRNINLQQFQEQCREKISLQISEFTTRYFPKQIKEKQTNETLYLFYGLIQEVYNLSQNPLSQKINFLQLLSLTGAMYSAIIKSQNIDFKKYCKFYQINILEACKMLFYLQKHLELPLFMNYYLAELQKQFYIKQIWQTNDGQTLVQNRGNPPFKIIIERLYKHIKARISQICEKMNIGNNQAQRIFLLIKKVIQQKPKLFEKNKLDQILVCAITVCLDFQKDNQALAVIFHHYNTSSFSYHSNCEGLYCQKGRKMNLTEYYNNVFLPQIKQIYKQLFDPNISLTPLRQQFIGKKAPSKFLPEISIFDKKTKSLPGIFQRGQDSSYKKRKLDSIKKFSQSPIEEEPQSPTFRTPETPGLKRSITFGDPK